MLKEKIINKQAGILTYGITPPKQNNSAEKIHEIAEKQINRIQSINIDALILYDIQEESDRIKDERPFSFLPTVDPVEYEREYLQDLKLPKIIYRCVGKYTREEFAQWLGTDSDKERYSVFVGAASHKQQVKLRLAEAYRLKREIGKNLILGGITIPERHLKQDDEHLRISQKTENGCRFFVSQTTYNVEASKNLLSDYYYYCKMNNIEMVPILFTLSPCGSLKTLEFMKWLGISIPRWLENELVNSEDILEQSILLEKRVFQELLDFASEKRIPIGCNVESVSIRKTEIEASVELVKEIKLMLMNANTT